MTYDNIITTLFPQGAPDNFKDYALLLSASTVQAMQAIQAAIDSEKHKISPVATTDGRWLVSADILPEFQQSGLFKRAIPYLQPSIFAGIEVVPWQEGIALLPEPENPYEI